MDVKKGLRNPLEEAQVRNAVVALQTFLEKQRASTTNKKELVATTEYISCIITRTTIPSKSSLKPIQIDLPHSLFSGDNDGEMCLFVKDTDKDRIKKALAESPVPGLAKVMTVKKLRKSFKQFEDRRTLADAYDRFLADDRILPYLKTPLGSKFFVKKKQPISVRVSRADVSSSIKSVFQRTVMHVSPGACTNVKIAHLGMPVDEIVSNIVTGMNNCTSHIPKAWMGIQSIHIKTSASIALPIYNALSEVSKLPPVANKKGGKTLKRKLDDVDVVKSLDQFVDAPEGGEDEDVEMEDVAVPRMLVEDGVVAVAAKKTQGKAKTTPVKKAPEAKTTPVKKVTEAKKAEPTPAKKAKAEATPVKKTETKKTTPVKKTKAETKTETTPVKKAETKKVTPVKKTKAAVETKATTPEPAAKKQKTTPQQQKTPEVTTPKEQKDKKEKKHKKEKSKK